MPALTRFELDHKQDDHASRPPHFPFPFDHVLAREREIRLFDRYQQWVGRLGRRRDIVEGGKREDDERTVRIFDREV